MPLVKFLESISALIDHVLVPLVFAIAFIVFIWGVFQYFIAGAGNEEKRNEGKQFVLYGIIGFFLMLSIWGIVNVLTGTFGFDSKARPDLPSFNGTGSGTGGAGGAQGGGLGNVGGQATQPGLPNGAVCISQNDAECASGECDWNGQRDSKGNQVFVCVDQRTPTPAEQNGTSSQDPKTPPQTTDGGTPTPDTVSNPATGLDGPPPFDGGTP